MDNASAALKAKNYDLAKSIYEPLANQGNATAQNELASMYVLGQGVTQDYDKGYFWFQKAADQGDGRAIFNLGVLHENGWGRPKDEKQAFQFYLQAAEKGFTRHRPKWLIATREAWASRRT